MDDLTVIVLVIVCTILAFVASASVTVIICSYSARKKSSKENLTAVEAKTSADNGESQVHTKSSVQIQNSVAEPSNTSREGAVEAVNANERDSNTRFYELAADYSERSVKLFRFLAVSFWTVAVASFMSVVQAIRVYLYLGGEEFSTHVGSQETMIRNACEAQVKTSGAWLVVSLVMVIAFSIALHNSQQKAKQFRLLTSDARHGKR